VPVEVVDDVAQILVVMQIDHRSVTAWNAAHSRQSEQRRDESERSHTPPCIDSSLWLRGGSEEVRTGHEEAVDGQEVSLAPRRERNGPSQASLPGAKNTISNPVVHSCVCVCVDVMSPGGARDVRLFFEVVLEPGLGLVVLARSAEPHLNVANHSQTDCEMSKFD
jgi:hypothetical protein